MISLPIYDRFETAVQVELDRYLRDRRRSHPRYEMPQDEAQKFMKSVECELRIDEYRKRIEPLVSIKSRMILVIPTGFVRHADGSLGEMSQRFTERQLKDIARIDAMIAWHAGECGVGPKCEPPSLAQLIEDYPMPSTPEANP